MENVQNVQSEIIEKIKTILSNELYLDIPMERLGLDDSLKEIAGLDSIGFTELRFQCEETFHFHVTDAEFIPDHFGTLNKLATFIETKRQHATNPLASSEKASI